MQYPEGTSLFVAERSSVSRRGLQLLCDDVQQQHVFTRTRCSTVIARRRRFCRFASGRTVSFPGGETLALRRACASS